jgi:hypothetical protein
MIHTEQPLLDAATTLVGFVNKGIERDALTLASGTAVKLSTPLDAARHFTALASHPGGHHAAVTIDIQVAPQLSSGAVGTYVTVASMALPATGGVVQSTINGQVIAAAVGDVGNFTPPAFIYAKAVVTSGSAPLTTPAGMYVGLTATVAA